MISFLDVSGFENRILPSDGMRKFFENLTAELRQPLVMLDQRCRVVAANQAFYRVFKTSPRETVDRTLFKLGSRQWDIEELRMFLEDIIPHNKHFDDYEVEADFPRIGRRKMSLNARRLYYGEENSHMILLGFNDVS